MRGSRGRVAAATAASSLLVAALLSVAAPAHANPPVTYKNFEAAMVNSSLKFSQAPGWVYECPTYLTSEGNVDLRIAAGATEVGARLTLTSQGQESTNFEYRSTTQWMQSVDDSMPYGFRKPLRNRILKEAKLPATAEYVTGPYAPWVSRYSNADVSITLAQYRQNFEFAIHGLSIPTWGADQGVAVTFTPQAGDGGTWHLAQQTGGVTLIARVQTDGLGRLISTEQTRTESGVTTTFLYCLTTDWISQPTIERPDPSLVVPLRKVGPVAWRVSTSVLAVQLGKAIRKGVKSSGQLTPSRIRGQSYIELTKRGLEGTWAVTDLATGAKISVSDPWGGTVARCITVKKGTLRSKRC